MDIEIRKMSYQNFGIDSKEHLHIVIREMLNKFSMEGYKPNRILICSILADLDKDFAENFKDTYTIIEIINHPLFEKGTIVMQ